MNKIIKKAPTVARYILGLAFLVFGLNGFLHFMPTPAMTGKAAQFMGGLGAAGYFFPFLKGTEVLVGALLLAGVFVPLALTVLAPITLNIVAFHLFLAPAGLPVPLFLLVLHLVAAWGVKDAYHAVLAVKTEPTDATSQTSSAHTRPGLSTT